MKDILGAVALAIACSAAGGASWRPNPGDRGSASHHVTEESIQLPAHQASRAIAVARAHVEAWSNHQFDKARRSLAADVHVTVTTTQPMMAATNLIGVDNYMDGLIKFAQPVVPGSARGIASVGDERNALLLVTVRAALGPGGANVRLHAARLYLLDENSKITAEQVVFFAVPQ